jgi:hypothetical protein
MEASMQNPVLSTIAQLLYASKTTVNYARIVAEMEQVLTRLKAGHLRASWDCEDLVFFDLDETRIALAITEVQSPQIGACLTVSVGPRPDAAVPEADPGYDLLCSRIVEKLQVRFLPLAILWNQTADPVGADLIDALSEDLGAMEAVLPPINDHLCDPLWQMAEAASRASTPAVPHMAAAPHIRHQPKPANDMPAISLRPAAEGDRLRQALYANEEDAANLSVPMRLAVHALNATLIMVWMPLGAAVMTYSLLKGEDMRVSGRIMAVTGTLLALAHSPIGHSVASSVIGI